MSRRLLVAGAVVVGALLLLLGGIAGALLTSEDGDGNQTSTVATPGTGKGYLGLTVSFSGSGGLRVASIQSDGPAAQSGLELGDIIRSVDGQLVRTPEQLRGAIESHKPGEQVSLTYERGDREAQARVTLGDAPVNAQIESTPAPQAGGPPQADRGALSGGRLGVTVQPITPQVRQRLNLQRDSGVVVTQVAPNSAAATAGLQTGDIILSVGATQITTVMELQRAVLAAPVDQAVDIGVQRGVEQLSLKATLPPQSSLQGLENVLPQALRERLQRQLDEGQISPEQLQQVLRLYQARGDNLRVGVVLEATATSLRLQPSLGGADVTVTLTPQTTLQRGGRTISYADLQVGETVLVLSTDGGRTALQVHAFGVIP